MAYDGIEPPRDENSGRALQINEHEHADTLAKELQRRGHAHDDQLVDDVQRREHEHEDKLGSGLQLREHEHEDQLAKELQNRDYEHQDRLQAMLQQREHQHEDELRALLQRREHDHQHALLDRNRSSVDPFQTQLALTAIVAAIVLNGGALLLGLPHATPLKSLPFAAGLVAGFMPTALAWTEVHMGRSRRARAARYAARLLWLVSIGLFAAGSVLAAA